MYMCHKIILDDKLCQEDLNVQCATSSYWMTSSVRRTLTYMYHKIILDDKLCQEDLNIHVPQDNTG